MADMDNLQLREGKKGADLEQILDPRTLDLIIKYLSRNKQPFVIVVDLATFLLLVINQFDFIWLVLFLFQREYGVLLASSNPQEIN